MLSDTDIQAARLVDVRQVVEQSLGRPYSSTKTYSKWSCPFHNEKSVGAFTVYKRGYRCFSCGSSGDGIAFVMAYHMVDFKEAVSKVTGEFKMDRVDFAIAHAKQVERDLEQKIKDAQGALGRLREARAWEEYHNNLSEESRRLWYQRGLLDDWIDFWTLGYNPKLELFDKDENGEWVSWWESPTLSIPLHNYEWDVTNIKHRLVNPSPNDKKHRTVKYWPEMRGIPQAPFVCNPESSKGVALVVEGEIKAMVTFAHLGVANIQVIGLPSATPSEQSMQIPESYEPVFVCLDPDAYEKKQNAETAPIDRVAQIIGKDRTRVFRFPDKIDDLITSGKLSPSDIVRTMKYAKKY